jgi:U3 small nucleolar RNA-associated protein 24
LGSVARRPQVSSALFFSYNMALGPPYRVIVDTNFINFSIQNKVPSIPCHPSCTKYLLFTSSSLATVLFGQ